LKMIVLIRYWTGVSFGGGKEGGRTYHDDCGGQ
jgi:hypothetical protein